MNFELFTNMVKDNVERKIGEDYTVSINKVQKNNGLLLTGLTIKGENQNIAPTIYLDEYYKLYQDGRYTICAITTDIINVFYDAEVKKPIDVKFFMDFDMVRPRIIHKLINYSNNEELLRDTVHVKFLDLAIIFQVMMPDEGIDDAYASITVKEEHRKIWNVDTDELVFEARRNTPRLLPYTFKSMKDVLLEMTNGEIDSIPGLDNIPMYVTSNEKLINGANAMLDKSFLRECANKLDDDYYILPSSINELIMLPANVGKNDVNYLKDMVKDVNNSCVAEEDILSDSVYYFNRENNRLSVL